jgi:hypothetical protein
MKSLIKKTAQVGFEMTPNLARSRLILLGATIVAFVQINFYPDPDLEHNRNLLNLLLTLSLI